MIYPYRCVVCQGTFEVVKSVAEIDRPESCAKCGVHAERYIARTHFYGARVEDAEFNPGLGMVTRNARHRRDEAKARGLVEIGNEKLGTLHKHAERTKADRYRERWDDDRVKVYD